MHTKNMFGVNSLILDGARASERKMSFSYKCKKARKRSVCQLEREPTSFNSVFYESSLIALRTI